MNNRTLVSAVDMAIAVQNDPQLSMPKKPRVLPGLVVIPMEDGLMVEGAGERQVFRGRNSTIFLPRLMELMDGTRTLAEIAEAFPRISPAHVVQATALLYTRGLLEDLEETPPADGPWDDELFKFLARHVDVTRVNRNIYEGMTRLAEARVIITGPEFYGKLLADELNKAGINTTVGYSARGEISAVDLDDITAENFDMIVAIGSGADGEALFETVNGISYEERLPWLRVHLAEDHTSIGPMFRVPETPCYECFSALNRGGEASEPGRISAILGVSLAASEIINTVSRLMPPITRQDTLYFDHNDWTQRRDRFPRRPGCENCSPIENMPPQMNLATAYEQAVAFPPKHSMSPKDHQVHYLRRNLELQHNTKVYMNAPRTPLPPVGSEGTGTLFDLLADDGTGGGGVKAKLSLQTLASLLAKTFGLRSGESNPRKVQRWAPTGGNLGSVQGYVLARDVPELPSGLYFYHAVDHELARLTAGPGEIDKLTPSGHALEPGNPAATLIFTGALQRVAAKYGPFAYRVIQLDAGAAAAQLYALAKSMSLNIEIAHSWNDSALEEMLQINPELEPITRVVTISGRGKIN